MRQAERIRYLLLAAQREGNRRLTAALKPLELSPAQSEVIRILGDHDNLTINGVGQMLVCDSGTNPSRIIDRLVQADLIERVPDPEDRRQVRLTLTTKGHIMDQEIRTIENMIYAEIDLLPGTAQLAASLAALTEGQPSGEALKRRIGA